MDFDPTVMWPVFKATGFLRRISVKPKAGGATLLGDVDWSQPDEIMGSNSRSREYRMEYLTADFPALAEGDTVQLLDEDDVAIAGMKFKVRAPAYVSNRPLDGDDGTYRMAMLTKV